MTRKEIATSFVIETATSDVLKAFKLYTDPSFKHHNVYTEAETPKLIQAMKESRLQFPDRTVTILHVLEDGDFVSVRSHIVMNQNVLEVIAVHTFKFKDQKIIEMWDTVQIIPEEVVNLNGF
ncbi:SnoaL-like domain [Acholeplasma oculi]|uniref:Polyketide cylcase, SnoaL-like domain n=1 Tax=Acholeplasma oculi TaxID=35623 RepID=A0A061A9C6_9MOLU|nr:nuclear transport factor 2 family protein [Acholeplasma oculi]CDR30458.1 Polyketide cylcase, SnoaL-like domain [Acholeplasma oculi]SKC51136.1 Predicted SnoaL-like aldol condensation-catalyzing enzyme [Acholeplasma oculi]SUT89059.1 SnoaL-like domain [Acholeplasma oculi]